MSDINFFKMNAPVQVAPDMSVTFEDNHENQPYTQYADKADTSVFSMKDGSSVSVETSGRFVFKPAGGEPVEVKYDPKTRSWHLPPGMVNGENRVGLSVDEAKGSLHAHVGGRHFHVDRVSAPRFNQKVPNFSMYAELEGALPQTIALTNTSSATLELVDLSKGVQPYQLQDDGSESQSHPEPLSVDFFMGSAAQVAPDMTVTFQDNKPNAKNASFRSTADTGVISMKDGSSLSVETNGRFVFKPADGSKPIEVTYEPESESWLLPDGVANGENSASVSVNKDHKKLDAHLGGRRFYVMNVGTTGPNQDIPNFSMYAEMDANRDDFYYLPKTVVLTNTAEGNLDLGDLNGTVLPYKLKERTVGNGWGISDWLHKHMPW